MLGAKVSVVTLRISRFSAFWTNGSADIDPRHLLAFSLSFVSFIIYASTVLSSAEFTGWDFCPLRLRFSWLYGTIHKSCLYIYWDDQKASLEPLL